MTNTFLGVVFFLFFVFQRKYSLAFDGNSYQMPSFIFSEKVRILYSTVMRIALRVKHYKWAFKH